MSPPALVGLLAASALSPVLAAMVGSTGVLAAGVTVVGSVGANVLTGVITGAIDRLRVQRDGADPDPEAVREAVAQRIEAAFAGGEADSGLRGEVIALFQAVDAAGAAFQRATEMDDQELLTGLTQAFIELSVLFSEFAFAVVRIRVVVEELRGDVRREIAQRSADREDLRRTAADLDRALDRVLAWERDRPAVDGQQAVVRPRWSGCPYLGLRPFQESDAAIFYGRREVTDRLLRRLGEHLSTPGILLVVGPSGAGKSSLLRAGLLAGLAADRLVRGCRTWPRLVLTPTSDPIGMLVVQLARLAGIDAIGVQKALAERPDGAHLIVDQILTRQVPRAEGEAPARLIVVVDQFEELFTLVDDHAVRERFLTILRSMACTGPVGGTPGALVVVGIRGDYLDQATAFPLLRDAVQAGVFAVTAMSEAELRQAVTGPAAEAGVQVPRELTDLIVEDLRERSLPTGFDSGALPLLSQVMFVMWTGSPTSSLDAKLTVTAYRRAGGVSDIVNRSAEEVYTALSEAEQGIARKVFLHLCAYSDGVLTRRSTPRKVLRAATGAGNRLDMVLNAFAEKRLLVFSDGDLVDVSHEELLRCWNTLHEWLQPNLADQALRRALAEHVHVWQERGRDASYLYRGAQLLAVQAAVTRWEADPTAGITVDATAVQFLAASQRRDRRSRRTYEMTAAALTVLLVVAGITAVEASRSAIDAKEQHALALSRQLAAQSRTAAAISRTAAERLAAAALDVADTEEARSAANVLAGDYPGVLPHSGTVAAVAFNPADMTLATGGQDKMVRSWDLATGIPVGKPLAGFPDWVYDVAFNATGTLLATASNKAVQLWDPATGSRVGDPLTHTEVVTDVAFNPAGTLLATAGADEMVRLWDPVTGSPVGDPLAGHSGPVNAVAFNPAGTLLATAGFDKTVRLWDPATGTAVGDPLTRHTDVVHDVTFNSAGTLLATASGDRTVRLWDPVTRSPVGDPLRGHRGPVNAVAFNPAGTRLATASGDETVRLWDPATRNPVGDPLTGHTGAVSAVAFNPAGTLLATAGVDATARLWHPATGGPIGGPLSHHDRVSAVAFNPAGTLLVTASNKAVQLWDPVTRIPVGDPLPGHSGPVNAVAFNSAGTLLATAGDDKMVRLWDPVTRIPVGDPLPGHSGPVNAVAFNSAGTLLATAGDDKTVRLWDPATRSPVGDPLSGHTGPVKDLAFNPAGNVLATASYPLLWGKLTGVPEDLFLMEGVGDVNAVAFNQAGTLLATAVDDEFHTAADDKSVWLWDPATRRPVGKPPLVGHTGPVNAVAFNQAGTLLATASDDRTVRLWDPSVYIDPVPSLCARAGNLTQAEWNEYAPDEPRVTPC